MSKIKNSLESSRFSVKCGMNVSDYYGPFNFTLSDIIAGSFKEAEEIAMNLLLASCDLTVNKDYRIKEIRSVN